MPLSRASRCLQLGVERMIAGDEPRGAGADAVALDRGDGRGLQRRMMAQPEIVVAGERQQPPAVALDPEAVAAVGRHQRAAQVRPLQRRRASAVRNRRARACLTYNSGPMDRNHWYEAGLGHVWLPYAQMKTVRPPLAVARTRGLPHRAGRRARADRRHRLLVDRLPRLQPSAHPARRSSGSSPPCRM